MNKDLHIFPFQWDCGDEVVKRYPQNVIRIWGWNEANHNVCVQINDFKVPMYVELPSNVDWKDTKNQNKIIEFFQSPFHKGAHKRPVRPNERPSKIDSESFCGPTQFPQGGNYLIDVEFLELSRLYDNELLPDTLQPGKYKNKQFGFIRLSFQSSMDLQKMVNYLAFPVPVPFMKDPVQFKCHCHSKSLTPVMKYFAKQKIPSTDWLRITGASRCSPPTCEFIEERTKHECTEPALYSQPNDYRGKFCSRHRQEGMIDLYKTDKNKIGCCKGGCCKADLVYTASFAKVEPYSGTPLPIVSPLICSWDIETYSSDENRFPDAKCAADEVIQIGMTFGRKGNVIRKLCIATSLDRTASEVKENDYDVLYVPSEAHLLRAWVKVIQEMNPDVLIGYNIFGFDIGYLVERSKFCKIEEDFLKISRIPTVPATVKEMKWESSARGIVIQKFLEVQGRLFFDLFPFVQANEKLNSYTLEAVASAKLSNINKDPIKAKDIFKAWREKITVKPNPLPRHPITNEEINVFTYDEVIKYCVQDTYVTYLLFEKMLVWLTLTESATTNKVPIFSMVSQGQQIKAYSQVYNYCYNNEIVCNPPTVKEKRNFEGALVTPPVPGLYRMILPFDFASLYPSIIIAHNIDFSTLVPVDSPIPQSDAPSHRWDSHVNCNCPKDPKYKPPTLRRVKKEAVAEAVVEADDGEDSDDEGKSSSKKKVVCKDGYHYRFLKSSSGVKGVIPTIIDDLLKARKKVRVEMERYEARIHVIQEAFKSTPIKDTELEEDKETIQKLRKQLLTNPGRAVELTNEMTYLKDMVQVLNKRQLAYKVNANSMYGMFGAGNGYLPLYPCAETVTAIGRESIRKASACLQDKFGGKVIYNDTDSAYTYFERFVDLKPKEIWEEAERMVKYMADNLFTKPMKLEFEGKIYVRFAIFTKKKYIAQQLDEHGNLKEDMYCKGVPLVLRSYCKNMKDIYERCIVHSLNNIHLLSSLTKDSVQAYQQQIVQMHVDQRNKIQSLRSPPKVFILPYQRTKWTVADVEALRDYRDAMLFKVQSVASSVNDKLLANPSVSSVDVSDLLAAVEPVTYSEPYQRFQEWGDMIMENFLRVLRGYWYSPEVYKNSTDPPIKLNDLVIYRGYNKESYTAKAPHVEVVRKIESRGTPVPVNSRIEYIMLADSMNYYDKNKTQSSTTEDLMYFIEFRKLLRVDFIQYFVSQYQNFMNQMGKVVYKVDDAVTTMIKSIVHKNHMVTELKKIVLMSAIKIRDELPDPSMAFTARGDLNICNKISLRLVSTEDCQVNVLLGWINYLSKIACSLSGRSYVVLRPLACLTDQHAYLFTVAYEKLMEGLPTDVAVKDGLQAWIGTYCWWKASKGLDVLQPDTEAILAVKRFTDLDWSNETYKGLLVYVQRYVERLELLVNQTKSLKVIKEDETDLKDRKEKKQKRVK